MARNWRAALPHIGQRLKKRVALFPITQRLIRQRGVTPLMYQYGETVITKTKEVARAVRPSTLTLGPKKPFSERPV
jgi:hypothetical protein